MAMNQTGPDRCWAERLCERIWDAPDGLPEEEAVVHFGLMRQGSISPGYFRTVVLPTLLASGLVLRCRRLHPDGDPRPDHWRLHANRKAVAA